MRYDRARQSLDWHATYIVASFVAGASAPRNHKRAGSAWVEPACDRWFLCAESLPERLSALSPRLLDGSLSRRGHRRARTPCRRWLGPTATGHWTGRGAAVRERAIAWSRKCSKRTTTRTRTPMRRSARNACFSTRNMRGLVTRRQTHARSSPSDLPAGHRRGKVRRGRLR